MEKIIAALLLLVFLLPVPVYAIKVSGLYEAQVPVSDQRAESRQAAIKTALQIVLVKLTGDRFAPGRTALAPVMQSPNSYVQQYRYNEVTKVLDADTQQLETELQLRVRFDSAILSRTLRELGMPVWGRERPSTLVWLVLQDEEGRHLVNMEDYADVIRVVDNRARMRGITLLFPLVDLEDTARLRPSDIWGGFREPVLDASARYQSDAILTGSISSSLSGIWEGRWTAYIDGQVESWATEGDLRDVVLDEGVDAMVDSLAARFVEPGSGLGSVEIAIGDIFSTDHYAKALKYLQSLTSVTDVQVKQVIPGKVTFLLTAHGGELAVMQAIDLGRTLEAVGVGDGSYRLLP